MKQGAWRAAIVMAAIVLALAGPSCTGSDVIESQRGQVSLQVAVSSTPGATYPWAKLLIGQIKYHPSDPAASNTQADPLAFLPSGFTVDLNNAGAATVSPVTITAQSYDLEEVKVNSFELNVDPVQPPGLAESGSCSGSTVTTLRTKLGEEVTFAPSCRFTVPKSGAIEIGVTIDGVGISNLFASKLNCSSLAFTPPTEAEILAFVSFQCD